jgi:hypothetical protein
MFDTASGAVDSDDGNVSFSWDESTIVTVDAPADLRGAFDTNEFYKIEGATIARPIKQRYSTNDGSTLLKKPAEELQTAAWSFDNAPFTLGHPDTGMVKDVDDVHGFWRNARYNTDEERLKEDLYVPVTDQQARDWLERHKDVSIGFYNRVHDDYDGDTGDLTDDDVDGFQVDMYGNHIAGVKRGRCSSEEGCGLDTDNHGAVFDASAAFMSSREMSGGQFTEGNRVNWLADAVVAHNPDDESGVMIEILDRDGNSTEMVTTVDTDSLVLTEPPQNRMDEQHGDAPSGIYVAEDGTWLAVGPSEHPDDNTDHPDDGKFPVDSCSDVDDAWQLRGHTDSIDIDKETLANRIERVDEAKDCGVVPDENSDSDCGCTNTTTTMTDDFDIPDVSVDALAEKNDDVSALRDERDELSETVDEMRAEIKDAFDSAEHITVSWDDDECPCEAIDDLVEEYDAAADKIDNLEDQLSEYRADEKADKLDTLTDYGADREDWENKSLDEIEEEIDRREEVAAKFDTSVKNGDGGSTQQSTDNVDKSVHGNRQFGRGYAAE